MEASQGQQVRSKRIPPARAALDRTHPAAAGCPPSHRTLESMEKFQAAHAFEHATATLCRVKPFCCAGLLLLLAGAEGGCFATTSLIRLSGNRQIWICTPFGPGPIVKCDIVLSCTRQGKQKNCSRDA